MVTSVKLACIQNSNLGEANSLADAASHVATSAYMRRVYITVR